MPPPCPPSRSSGSSAKSSTATSASRSARTGTGSEEYDADPDHQWNDRGRPAGDVDPQRRERGRRRDPPLLLPPEAFDRRKLPDVPRGGRKVSQAADRLLHGGQRRDGR